MLDHESGQLNFNFSIQEFHESQVEKVFLGASFFPRNNNLVHKIKIKLMER